MSSSKRNERLPPGQYRVDELPVLHVGSVPVFDQASWTFEVYGLVERPLKLSWGDFLSLPRYTSVSDFHCVEGWSRLDNKWEGVSLRTIVEMVEPKVEARFCTIECEGGYTTSLPIEDLIDEDVLLAYRLNDGELSPEHGGPLRLVVPKKYAYKSAKWVRRIKFTEQQELGYWEKRGYSDTADPWKEERMRLE